MFTIFSKPGCVFCEKFKAIVELEDIKHVVYELDRDFTKEEFYSKFGEGSTFPQITFEDKHLGGCKESIEFMREENICCRV